jgi:SAM-dependent methyltransferase
MLASVLSGLDNIGVLESSLGDARPISELLPGIPSNGFSYLRVALRCLACVGWIEPDVSMEPDSTFVRWTEDGRAIAASREKYLAVGRYLREFPHADPEAYSRSWSPTTISSFEALVERANSGWNLAREFPAELRSVVVAHLDGGVLVPAMLRLHGIGAVGEAGLISGAGDSWTRHVVDLLRHVGWLHDDSLRWTQAGAVARSSSTHYGLAASYLPLLSRLPDLFLASETVDSSLDSPGPEWHVNRSLNVTASGAAHGRYFADAEDIICDVFGREPLAGQPRFVADMGCGDGSWLAGIYQAVRARTLRGRNLAAHPLVMVGLDANEAALERARAVLDQHNVPSLLVRGDISDPDRVAALLAARGLQMDEGLHIRSFIDHDRDYRGADDRFPSWGWATGAYVGPDGAVLTADEVERDLVGHLSRWAPHVRRHGLVILEAHGVPPAVSRRHLGALHSVAFDAYHGFSHQYPVEHASFLYASRAAGLEPDPASARRYPTSRPFVAVSLNRFVSAAEPFVLPGTGEAPQEDGAWAPDPGLELTDGEGLHRLLYQDGDLRQPRPWCLAPTGWIVERAFAQIESRLAVIAPGGVIRILDYGTGSGLAAIELLKALGQRDIDARLERAGARLELHLADLPSAWFAQGHRLMRACKWARFHSLRNDDGGFRALTELVAPNSVDVVMASMVFHLIPQEVLARVAAELSSILAPEGRLLWNSPDLGPAGSYAVLFHDPNRALRKRWASLLNDSGSDASVSAAIHSVAARVAATLGPAERKACERRASKRILPVPNTAGSVSSALEGHLQGSIETRTFEMLEGEVLDALLVPSNVGEYLPEIEDPAERNHVATTLLTDQVLPEFASGPAATGLGVNVHWTFGDASAA